MTMQDTVDRKTRSYAYEMEELPKLGLKKQAIINNFLLKQPSIVEEEEESLSLIHRIPGLGVFLTILSICIYQGGNVVAKKMTLNPFMMIFLRDFITLFYSIPFSVYAKTTPFPRGPLHERKINN